MPSTETSSAGAPSNWTPPPTRNGSRAAPVPRGDLRTPVGHIDARRLLLIEGHAGHGQVDAIEDELSAHGRQNRTIGVERERAGHEAGQLRQRRRRHKRRQHRGRHRIKARLQPACGLRWTAGLAGEPDGGIGCDERDRDVSGRRHGGGLPRRVEPRQFQHARAVRRTHEKCGRLRLVGQCNPAIVHARLGGERRPIERARRASVNTDAAINLQASEETSGRRKDQRELLEIAGLPVKRRDERSWNVGAKPTRGAQLTSTAGTDAERHAGDVERAAVVTRAARFGRAHGHVADGGLEPLKVDRRARVRDVVATRLRRAPQTRSGPSPARRSPRAVARPASRGPHPSSACR